MEFNQLPPQARTKFRVLSDAATESETLLRATLARISALDKKSAIEGNSTTAPVRHELERLREVMEQHKQRSRDRINLIARLEAFIKKLPNNGCVKFVRTASPLKKGETWLECLARVRCELFAAQLKLAKIEKARLDPAEQRQLAKEAVERMAERGKRRPLIGNDSITFDSVEARAMQANLVHLLNVLAWFDPARMLEKIEEEIDGLPPAEVTLTQAERLKQSAALRDLIDTLGREEEAAVEMAERNEGIILERRPAADPAAVLGIKLATATARRAA